MKLTKLNFVIRGHQGNWDFKSGKHQQNDCSSGGTTFEDPRVPQGSSSIKKTSGYKSRNHQKALEMSHARKWQERHRRRKLKISIVLYPGWSKIWEEKNLRHSRKLPLRAAMVQKRQNRSTRLLNDLRNRGNRILSFSKEKTLTDNPIFNKQIATFIYGRIATFGNDVSEHHRVSTTSILPQAWCFAL